MRVLFGIPTRFHIDIAVHEMEGLMNLGYDCDRFDYAAKEGVTNKAGRLLVIFQNAFRMIKKAYKFKPDIIYINSRLEILGSTRDFITVFLSKILYYKKVHFIIKSHGSEIDVLRNNAFHLKKIVFPFLKKNISVWLFLSYEERNELMQINYFNRDRIFVIKNIVDKEQFAVNPLFRKMMGIPDDTKILLFVSRVIKEKGIYEVVDSFKYINFKYKVKLIIVGDGNEFSTIKTIVLNSGIAHDVIFTGFLPEKNVAQFYANSDILVFPTYDSEGFPMALFNSVAAGLAIVTTPIRAALDYLSEGKNCIWVKPKSSDSVTNALDRILSSDELLQQMRVNNKILSDKFTQVNVCRELHQILSSLN